MQSEDSPTRTPEQAVSPTLPRFRVSAWFAWSLVSAVALAAIHYWIADPAQGPRIFADEIGYLANARFLAGGGKIDMSHTAFYAGGFSLILTPVSRLLLNHPARLYQAIVIGQAMLAGASILLIAQLCRWILATPKSWSIAVAFAAGLYPAFVMNTGFTWAESMLTFTLLVVVTASVWVLRGLDQSARGSRTMSLRAATAGMACGALVTMHNRTVLAAFAALAIVSWSLLRARLHVPVVTLVVTAAITGGAGQLLNQHLQHALWAGAGGIHPDQKITRLLHPHGLWAGGLSLAGQSWYQLVGSAGLVAIALVGLVHVARARSTERVISTRTFTGDARRAGAAVVVAVYVSLLLVSAAFTAAGKRGDYVVYGRYVDIGAPLLIALAIAWLGTRPSRRALGFAAFALFTSLGGTFLILTWAGKTELGRPFNRLTTLAITGWLDYQRNSPALFRATGWSIGFGLGAIAIAYIARAEPARSWTAIAMVCVGISLVFVWQLSFMNENVLKPLAFGAAQTRAVVGTINEAHAEVLRLEPSITVVDRLALEFWLPKVDVLPATPATDRCSTGLSISRGHAAGPDQALFERVPPFSLFQGRSSCVR